MKKLEELILLSTFYTGKKEENRIGP